MPPVVPGKSGASSGFKSIRTSVAFVRRAWPLIPIAPTIVVVVSLMVATAIGFVGADSLRRVSDDAASNRAQLLGSTLGQRLRFLSPAAQIEALQIARERTGAEFVLAHGDGSIITNAGTTAPNSATIRHAITQPRGEMATGLGRSRYVIVMVDRDGSPKDALMTFVSAPLLPSQVSRLLTAPLGFVALLILVAALASHLVAREANQNVVYLTRRVLKMVSRDSEMAGETVPVRTMDEVGVLAASFNDLVGRFVEAEKRYRGNLDRADAADRDRATFLAAVSHELRSPLNAILGFADLLLQEVDGPLDDEAREEVEQIRGSGGHLLELINDILEFSALEAGQLKLTRARTDIVVIATSVLREAEALTDGRPITLRREGEETLSIDADQRRVRQILTNIVANAVKFTAEGEIVVGITKRGSFARISVSDTGPGIGPEERAVIFEDYRQVGDRASRKRGTGLGLAIARRLVLMHGGSIDVESELGRGSTFHIFLPIGNADFFKPKRSS